MTFTSTPAVARKGRTIAPALFLFDIDGTLLTGAAGVHRDAFAHAFRTVYGLPLDLDGIATPGRTDAWILAETLRRHGVDDERIVRSMHRAFALMEVYVEQHPRDLRDAVLPGVPRVLRALRERGVALGLLTGNLRRIALAKLRQAGLADYFMVGGFGDASEVRADLVPVALAAAGAELGRVVDPSEVALVGDTPLDVEAGQQAATRTVGVATGRYSVDELRRAGADLVLPSFADADDAIRAMLRL